MRLMKYFALLSVILVTACAKPEPEVRIQTKFIKPNVTIQAHPRPVLMRNVEFYVVTKDNLADFEKRFTDKNGQFVFVAMSLGDYENISLNLADLRRYINQQKQIIVFYEKSLS